MIAIIDYGMGNLRSVQAAMKHLGRRDYYLAAQPQQLDGADRIILPGVGAYGAASKALFGSGMAEALRQKVAEGRPLLGICLGMQMLFQKGVEFGEHPGLGFFPGDVTRFGGEGPAALDANDNSHNAESLNSRQSEALRHRNMFGGEGPAALDANDISHNAETLNSRQSEALRHRNMFGGEGPAALDANDNSNIKVPHMGWNVIKMNPACPLFYGLSGDVYAYFAHSYMAADMGAPHAAGVTEYGGRFISVVWGGNVYGTQFHPEKSGAAGLKMLYNFLEVV